METILDAWPSLKESSLCLLCAVVMYLRYVCCRFNHHPVLNDRYLLLSLLGKGGFSEVHKVSSHTCVGHTSYMYITYTSAITHVHV